MDAFCGIDWAEDHHDIALVDRDGQLLARARISDDAAGLARLLELLAEHGDSPEEPVPVAGHRHRVDRADRAAGRAQARGQQAARGLDRHRDRLFGAVAVLGEQLQQPGQAGRVVADARPGQQLPVAVHQGDVVVVFGQSIPQNASKLILLLRSQPLSVLARAVQGTRAP